MFGVVDSTLDYDDLVGWVRSVVEQGGKRKHVTGMRSRTASLRKGREIE